MPGSPKKRAKREAAARAGDEAVMRGEILAPKSKRGPELKGPPKEHKNGKRSPEIENEILERLAAGEYMRAICRDPHIPTRNNVSKWCLDDPEGFGTRLSMARELGSFEMADEVLEIADDKKRDLIEKKDAEGNTIYVVDREVIERARTKIDARKWYLAKMFPKQFGDRLTHDGGVNISLEKMFQEIDAQDQRLPLIGSGNGDDGSKAS